jgi:hypothetical protein
MGRYRSPKTPLRERICTLCNEETGDEVHFLTACHSLEDHRVKLTGAMTTLYSNYTSLVPIEKTKKVLEACASNKAVSDAIYEMYIYRANLLR